MTAETPRQPIIECEVCGDALTEYQQRRGYHCCSIECAQAETPLTTAERAKRAAVRQRRREADEAHGAAWLAGMRARDARTKQIRHEMHWSAEQYPTDVEQLDQCLMPATTRGGHTEDS